MSATASRGEATTLSMLTCSLGSAAGCSVSLLRPCAPMCGAHWVERDGEPAALRGRFRGMELTCPKCHGPMRTYERNGVHVDQCTECRGIFLDRGELDRLIDAENAWHGGTQAAERHEDDRRHESRSGSEHRSEYRSEHGPRQ